MKSSVSSVKNQWSNSLKNTLNLKDTAESLSTFNNVRAMSVLIDLDCFDQLFLVFPPTALPMGPSQPWALSRCLSYAVGVLVSSSMFSCGTAMSMPGHGPPWSEPNLPGLISALPCHHGLAWQSPDCTSLCLLPLDLTLICKFTSWHHLRPASSLWACLMTRTPGWPQLPSLGLPCLGAVGLGPATLVSFWFLAPCPLGSSRPLLVPAK